MKMCEGCPVMAGFLLQWCIVQIILAKGKRESRGSISSPSSITDSWNVVINEH